MVIRSGLDPQSREDATGAMTFHFPLSWRSVMRGILRAAALTRLGSVAPFNARAAQTIVEPPEASATYRFFTASDMNLRCSSHSANPLMRLAKWERF
jgi:hypothetical protein